MKMMTCKEASHLISAGRECPLSRRERWGLRLHLWLCDNCRRFERQVRFLGLAMRMLARRTETDASGPELPPEARERIRQALYSGDGADR